MGFPPSARVGAKGRCIRMGVMNLLFQTPHICTSLSSDKDLEPCKCTLCTFCSAEQSFIRAQTGDA